LQAGCIRNYLIKKMKAKILTKQGITAPVPLNRRKAIRLRCWDCSGFEYNEVSGCDRTDCELYPYRMGTGKQNAKARNKAIRFYCVDNCMLGQVGEVTQCTSRDLCPLYIFRVGYNTDKGATV